MVKKKKRYYLLALATLFKQTSENYVMPPFTYKS